MTRSELACLQLQPYQFARHVKFTSPAKATTNVIISAGIQRVNDTTLSPCLRCSDSRIPRPASLAISPRLHLPNPKLHRRAACSVALHNLSNLRDKQATFLPASVLHSLKRNRLCFPMLGAIRSQTFSAHHNHNSRREPQAVGFSEPLQR